MTDSSISRRAMLAAICATASAVAADDKATHSSSNVALDEFIGRYMRQMGAPGLTLGIANRAGTVRAASFGYSELESKTPVTPEHLFQIGSITKSFVALTLLQLRDQGKLDLEKPILDYLPWLPVETNYGPVTVHHLLTHTSGLPNALTLFLSDPSKRHVQAFKPGSNFDYCNLGFAILGYLIEHLDGRPWPEAVEKRIFAPLGMDSSHAAITMAIRDRMAMSYKPYREDRVFTRAGKLGQVSGFVFEDAAGSIVSTPADMARYLTMLLNHGAAPRGRVVSEESFALFRKPYIKAAEFSPTASYGYGVAVDQLDGHTVLRHTGGMVSFMSSMHVDLDGGFAAFASINAQEGYRPVPVTQYAIQLMRAEAEKTAAPTAPVISDPLHIENAKDYEGTYASADGKQIQATAANGQLILEIGGKKFPLEGQGSDTFVAQSPEHQRFSFVFGRSASGGPVVELSYGPQWYTNSRYTGPKNFPAPKGFEMFAGCYRADTCWGGSMEVVIRKGMLWLDGTTLLEPLGENIFRVGSQPSAETAEFLYTGSGKARVLKLTGMDLWRVEST